MDSINFQNETLKKKIAHPYEYFNFEAPLSLSKEDFYSILAPFPPDEEINRSQEVFEKYFIQTGQLFILFYLKLDVLHLDDVFQNSLGKFENE